MNPQEQELYMIRGMLSEAPPDTKKEIIEVANRIRTILFEHGDEGRFALALVAAELNAEVES